MDGLLLWAVIAATSSGAAVASSRVFASKVKQLVSWRVQTKAEKLLEQKELGRWMIMEVTRLSSTEVISKEKIAELLHQITVFYTTANLQVISNMKLKECLDAASTAMEITERLDHRYVKLLSQLTDGVVAAVLRTSGEREGIHMSVKTLQSLSGIAPGFRSYSGGAMQIAEWKNEILKNNQKDMK